VVVAKTGVNDSTSHINISPDIEAETNEPVSAGYQCTPNSGCRCPDGTPPILTLCSIDSSLCLTERAIGLCVTADIGSSCFPLKLVIDDD
jgi:hypothetical protein